MKISKLLALVGLVCMSLGASAKSDGTLSVMSYNIRNGEAEDGLNSWKYRYVASAMMIDDQKPDIFGLQEAYQYQMVYLNDYTQGYKGVGIGREDGKLKGTKSGEIMAIFYNTETISLLKWGTYWLSETPDKPSKGWDAACKRTATWALMKDKRTGKKFYYVNTHLDHVGREAQKNGLKVIVERIAAMNKEGYPMVLTGDFNVSPDDEVLDDLYKMMRSCRATAAVTDNGTTYHDWGKVNNAVIDHIFYSGFSSCTKFEVVKKPYDGRNFVSDHYPVKAQLVF